MNKFCILILSSYLFFIMGCAKPEVSEMTFSKIDTANDPIQIQLSGDTDVITKDIKNGKINIEPVAEYKVAGKVAHNGAYDDWVGKFTPISDVTLIWGKLADPESEKYLEWRILSPGWAYKAEGPLDASYLQDHFGRYYVYPANDNIGKAVRILKKNEKVVMEGFLINTKFTNNGEVSWTIGRLEPGWCKFFYVKKIRIGNNIYK